MPVILKLFQHFLSTYFRLPQYVECKAVLPSESPTIGYVFHSFKIVNIYKLSIYTVQSVYTYNVAVVVHHVTIVAIGHGLLKKFWPMVRGCVLRTAGSSII